MKFYPLGTLRSSSAWCFSEANEDMALPYHPKDWFSHLQTTKYQQLMPDLF